MPISQISNQGGDTSRDEAGLAGNLEAVDLLNDITASLHMWVSNIAYEMFGVIGRNAWPKPTGAASFTGDSTKMHNPHFG